MPFVFDVRPFRWRRVVPRVMVALLAAVAVPSYAAAHSAPAQSQTTLHTSANLVVLDVTVSDARHDAVHHLAATDFTVLEDGKPQTVTVFEEHGAGSPAPAPLAHAPRLAPGAFTNESAAPQDGALNILMFDQLNTPATAQADVRAQVLQYLRDAPAGTRMAIFSLTTELKLLQGFTTNPELLRALVEGKKGNPGASAVMNDPIHGGGDQPGSDDAYIDNMRALLNQVASENGSASMAAAMESLQQFESFQQSLQLQIRVHYTLDALNQLAHALSGLPGRKNLIWFSGSFPLSILPDPDLPGPLCRYGFAGGRIQGDHRSAVARPGFGLSHRRARRHAPSPSWTRRTPEANTQTRATRTPSTRTRPISLTKLPASTTPCLGDGRSNRRRGVSEHQWVEGGGGAGRQRRVELLHRGVHAHGSQVERQIPQDPGEA